VHARAQEASSNDLDSLRLNAVNVFRSPKQSWPGYGIYLGRGLVITAGHVVGRVELANPSVAIAGQELTAEPVKQGDFEGVDLTLLRIDASRLPPRAGLRVLPLCEAPPGAGEAVVTVTPETVAHSTILSPERLPPEIRFRFGTVIADVATTGNSGSGSSTPRRNVCWAS
jgi:Trypsin-like peptidase domain